MPTSPTGFNSAAFLRRISRTITDFDMCRPGDRVLVALSGGPDSVALLHSLHRLSPELDIAIGAAHFNHRLRGDAAETDAAFAERTARRLGLAFFSHAEDVAAHRARRRESIEEAARNRRYAFLMRTARRYHFTRIATGHTADDNAEQVLMQLLRGSGPKGMSGIPPVRGPIVRPLLRIRRPEILDYLSENRIGWVEDASNTDDRFQRNRIRKHVMPMLETMVSPTAVAHINRLTEILRAEEEWLDALTESLYGDCLIERRARQLSLAVERLVRLHPAAQRRVVRNAIAVMKGDTRRLSFSHVEATLAMVGGTRPSGEVHLPDGIHALRRYDRLVISRTSGDRRENEHPGDYRYEMTAPGTLNLPEAGMTVILSATAPPDQKVLRRSGHRVAFFDMDKICFPLTIRNARAGDRFQPLGMHGTQKLKAFFINNKIPRNDRWRWPVVISRGRIIWVPGHRIAESAKVDAGTRNALRGTVQVA